MPRSRHRAGSLMTPPSPLPLFQLFCFLSSSAKTLRKLSPRRTFSPCPSAAYQRAGSPAPPPACPGRPGWTRAGRFSRGLAGLSDTRRYRRECPGQRGEKRDAWDFIYSCGRRLAQAPRCGNFSKTPGGGAKKQSMRRWGGEMATFAANNTGKTLICLTWSPKITFSF